MKVVKFFGKCFLACFLLIVIFWMIILATLQTKSGQQWAFTQVKSYLERTSETKIQIKDLHFSFPLQLSFEDVAIWQDNHPILTIQDLEITCAYSKLLQGRLVFSKLQASGIDLFQLPHDSDTPFNSDTPIDKKSLPWENPLLPFYVKFENIDIQRLRLAPPLIDSLHLPQEVSSVVNQASLSLQGMITNNPFKSALTAHLLLTAKSDQIDFSPFSLGIDTQNHQLSLSFHWDHLPLQVIDPSLPQGIEAHLAFYASSPVATWQSLVQDPLQENQPIEGHFKFTLQSPVENSTPFSTLIGKQTVLRSRYLLKSTREVELFDINVENPNLILHGKAIVNPPDEIQQGYFQGEIDNLNAFRAWLGSDVEGTVAIEGKINGPISTPSLVLNFKSPKLLIAQQMFENIQATLDTSPLNKTLNGFANLSFDYQNIPWKLASSFDWNDQKQLTLSHLQIDAMRSHLEGDLSCSTSDFICEGFLEAHTDNLTDITHFLPATINGEGKIKVQLRAALDSDQQKRQQLHAEFRGKTLQWRDWQAQQLILNLDLNPVKEEGDSYQIQASVEGQEIHWKDYFIGQCTAHSIQTLDINQRHLDQISADWKAQYIQWPEGKASEATGKVDVQHPFESIEGNLRFAIHDIQTSSFSLQELMGSTAFHPSQSPWPFQIQGKGFWNEDIQFDAAGNWNYQNEILEVQTQRLSGRFGPQPFQIKQPLHFSKQTDDLQVAGLWLQWGKAEIQADFHRNHQTVTSRFKTNDIPLELFHFIAPQLPLSGRASFQGQLEGDVHQPKGELQIDLHQIQITENLFAQKPFIKGKLFLNLDQSGIHLKSELNGIGNSPLLISGHLPFSLSIDPFDFKKDPQLSFDIALNAEGELDPYLHLFYNDTNNLSGHAKIALRLGGQMDAPQITGSIDLVNGVYESLSTGALYRNIRARLEGDGTKVILTNFSAQDKKGGVIKASGSVNLDAGTHFPFEFQIQPAHIFIIDSDYAAISASGSLSLTGNTKKSKLQGELTADQATIHLEEALPQQIKTIDIKYINVPKGAQPPNLEKNEAASAIDLDVKLNAQNVLIQSKTLKSEWKGNITVTGTPDHPQLHGDLYINHGEYDLRGKIFNLSHGNIHFAGAPDKKTSLYIVASKELDRITAEIIVKGPVTKPVVSFRSNPPLSQREVLSYLLFNRGISDITQDQGDQLSQSFISLNSSEQTKSSDDFLSRLRNNIGIDRLDFTSNSTSDNQDFGLQVGKHITENIMISVNQSMVSLTPVIAVEAKLHKNIKAQAEAGVGENTPTRMSIKWKKDY